jgi:bifunctional DNA-binding transcriptional regulator/antitoxin component of YhaV-PrlF toxin-antitoxin module
MATETFKTRIIDSNRITIPEESVELLKVKKGDIVKVTIETVKS